MFTILGLATKREQIGPTEVFLTCYMGDLVRVAVPRREILVASYSLTNRLFIIGGSKVQVAAQCCDDLLHYVFNSRSDCDHL
jgi:hypothetical protein